MKSRAPIKTLTLNTNINDTHSYFHDPMSPWIDVSRHDRGLPQPRELLPYLPYLEKSMDLSQNPLACAQKDFHPVETVKNWLRTCDQQHCSYDGCQVDPPPLDDPWSRPLLLIDVENNCLVSTPPTSTYVALSYTWGKSNGASTCTLRENITRFKEPGGLVADEGTLPKTIKDTIAFVRQIGERYLWVDRFCIVQDETVAKQSQLDAMGKIYAGSYFTIIAAQSNDASGPLHMGPLRKTAYDRSPTEYSGTQIMVDQTSALMSTAWYSRAWTFQEYLFSKRKVVFQDGTVNWECGISAWHEAQEVSTDTIPEFRFKHNLARSSSKSGSNGKPTGFDFPYWPDMSRYARLVSLFNTRELTFPEDVLDAFAGVLSHVSRVFPGGLVSGIPVMCFDAALLWQPHRPMERRYPIKSSNSEAILPSWSWAGWAGVISSESWRSAANYLFEREESYRFHQCSWKTFRTVEWSYSLSLESRRKAIKPTIQAPSDPMKPEVLTANTSWTWVQEEESCFLFYHSDFPSQAFRYPIPMRDQYVAHIPPINARYLHCTTMRAFLQAGETFWNAASVCSAVELRTTGEIWAGCLRLMDYVHSEEKSLQLGTVELVAISAGSVENSVEDQDLELEIFDEWDRLDCLGQWEVYEFVNVLWVEWLDGVAYRKGLGRVEKGVWGSLEKETIDLTLG